MYYNIIKFILELINVLILKMQNNFYILCHKITNNTSYNYISEINSI